MITSLNTTSLKIGVVLALEGIDHAWQDHRWQLLSGLVGIPNLDPGFVLQSEEGFTHYYAGTSEIEMHRKETLAYVVNLENDVPVVYIVATDPEDEDGKLPYDIRLVTVSLLEVQDYSDSGEDIVDAIPMIEPLVVRVGKFVEEHHQE